MLSLDFKFATNRLRPLVSIMWYIMGATAFITLWIDMYAIAGFALLVWLIASYSLIAMDDSSMRTPGTIAIIIMFTLAGVFALGYYAGMQAAVKMYEPAVYASKQIELEI